MQDNNTLKIEEKQILSTILKVKKSRVKLIYLLNKDLFFEDNYSSIFYAIKNCYVVNKKFSYLDVENEYHLINKNKSKKLDLEKFVEKTKVFHTLKYEELAHQFKSQQKKQIVKNNLKYLTNNIENDGYIYSTLFRKHMISILGYSVGENISSYEKFIKSQINPETNKKMFGNKFEIGNKSLDGIFEGGFVNRGITVIAGSSGSGKTTLAINTVRQSIINIINNKINECIMYCSFDMPPEFAEAYASSILLNIPIRELISENSTLEDLGKSKIKKILEYDKKIKQIDREYSPFFVVGDECVDISDLYYYLLNIQEKSTIKLLVIDYIQLMEANEYVSYGSKTNLLSYVMKKLSLYAQEFNIPVLLLCQLVKNKDSANEIPSLKNIADTAAIERHASQIVFSYIGPIKGISEEERMYAIVSKSRFGNKKKNIPQLINFEQNSRIII